MKGSEKFRFVILPILLMIGGVSIWIIRGKVTSTKIQNVLLISIDTCRADYLSCYGYSSNTTPNIDAIAKDGVLFENVDRKSVV